MESLDKGQHCHCCQLLSQNRIRSCCWTGLENDAVKDQAEMVELLNLWDILKHDLGSNFNLESSVEEFADMDDDTATEGVLTDAHAGDRHHWMNFFRHV